VLPRRLLARPRRLSRGFVVGAPPNGPPADRTQTLVRDTSRSPSRFPVQYRHRSQLHIAQCWRDRISKPFRICTATLSRSFAGTDCFCVPINSLAPPPPRRPSWWSLPRLVFRRSEDFQTLVSLTAAVDPLFIL